MLLFNPLTHGFCTSTFLTLHLIICSSTNADANADGPKREVKEEKKRRSSVFAKFGSYRQKKVYDLVGRATNIGLLMTSGVAKLLIQNL